MDSYGERSMEFKEKFKEPGEPGILSGIKILSERMTKERIPERIFQGKPDEERLKGRKTKKSWLTVSMTTSEDLVSVGLSSL